MKKKIFTALFVLFLMAPAFAEDATKETTKETAKETADVTVNETVKDAAKEAVKEAPKETPKETTYTVLKTTFDYTPIRTEASADATRFTHLKSGITLFGEGEGEFYKVNLGTDKPYWVEKRYVEANHVATINNIGAVVSNVKFTEDSKNYYLTIKTPVQTSYQITQTPSGLDFQLFNSKTSKDLIVKNNLKTKNFEITSKQDEPFKASYLAHGTVYGYDVQRKNNALVLKVAKPLKIHGSHPLKGVKIALDAGHGGKEPGVISGGYVEKDINLKITKKLRRAFRMRGAKVYMIRKTDSTVGLYERVNRAKAKNADFLISIHQNSLPNRADYLKRHGSGVYYYNKNAEALANSVEDSLTEATGFRKDGVFNASFALTRPTSPVSILVECGYLIYPPDRIKLTSRKSQRNIAKSIVQGVENYLRAEKL